MHDVKVAVRPCARFAASPLLLLLLLLFDRMINIHKRVRAEVVAVGPSDRRIDFRCRATTRPVVAEGPKYPDVSRPVTAGKRATERSGPPFEIRDFRLWTVWCLRIAFTDYGRWVRPQRWFSWNKKNPENDRVSLFRQHCLLFYRYVFRPRFDLLFYTWAACRTSRSLIVFFPLDTFENMFVF